MNTSTTHTHPTTPDAPADAGAPTNAVPLQHDFVLDAALHCLDFINTLEGRHPGGTPSDRITSYADLVLFNQATGALPADAATHLLAVADAQPQAAQRVLGAAREMREQMFIIFSSIAADAEPPAETMAAFSNLHRELHAQTMIVPTTDRTGFADVWNAPGDLRQALWAPCAEAVDLLLRGPMERVRECAGEDCRWIFLDVSRNQSRRWCSMSSCGNRAKVANFRERERQRKPKRG